MYMLMKKILPTIFLFVLAFNFGFAQLEIMPNPSNINSGELTIKYGENSDYSIFDPLSDPNLYLYTGIESDGNAATWDYHDDWTDISTQIPLTYNATLGYYVATVDPATHPYIEEITQNVVNLPNGLQVNDWYFIIRNADGSRQSGDLKGSDYGFTAGQLLSVESFKTTVDTVKAVNGSLVFSNADIYTIEVYDVLGKQVFNTRYSASINSVLDLQLKTNGVFIVRISANSATKVLKMINY